MISVMMPVFNAEKFVGDAIESILRQTDPDFELIVVNDGSTDGSECVIRSYSDPRIVYISQDNQGEGASRNRALEAAKGEWIAFQDADDISLPMRLEVLKRQAVLYNAGFAHSDLIVINEESAPVGFLQSSQVNRERVLRHFLRLDTPYMNPSMLLRREVFDGKRYDASIRNGTDSDVILQIALQWPSVHVPEPLYLYRQHQRQVSAGRNETTMLPYHQKFLRDYSIMELIPEVAWIDTLADEQKAIAYAIAALFFVRKGFPKSASEHYDIAVQGVTHMDNRLLVEGLGHLGNQQYDRAMEAFNRVSRQDHIFENYMGETLAMGFHDWNAAFTHYRKSLDLAPQYYEPIENLKNLVRALVR